MPKAADDAKMKDDKKDKKGDGADLLA